MTLASLTFRTRYGTAVYIKSDLNHTEICYDVEITVTVLSHPFQITHVVSIYRSKTGRISQLIEALTHLHESVLQTFQPPSHANLEVLKNKRRKTWKLGPQTWRLQKYASNKSNNDR